MGSCCGSYRQTETGIYLESGDHLPLERPKMASALRAATISPKAKHTATVIFLHGLGDTGDGWCETFREAAHPYIKYIFPHAPAKPVTLNGGMVMPSWFDIKGLSPNTSQDEDGIKESSKLLTKLIDDEKECVSADRIVIGGFSQGGAVALYTALTTNTKLGGILAFSTWLPLHEKIMGVCTDTNKKTPILQCHGNMDPMVPFTWGNMTAQFLKQLNPEHKIITLDGVMHSSSPQELSECKTFLSNVLP